MAENSKIEWTDHTFNPWIGCTKVSPACDNCYAETFAKRTGGPKWGKDEPRRLTSHANWQKPLAWDRKAARLGVRYRVFCASLADVFDVEVPDDWRDRLLALIAATPHLDWLLLTKRPKVAADYLGMPADTAAERAGHGATLNGWDCETACAVVNWINGWSRWHDAFFDGNPLDGSAPRWPLPNLWLGTTVETQAMADARIPWLLDAPAAKRFVSMEPLLGPVDLTSVRPHGRDEVNALLGFDFDQGVACNGLNWVISGGESGVDARPSHPDWFRGLRDQCAAAQVPFLFKQWGECLPVGQVLPGFGKVHGATAVKQGRMKLHCGGGRDQTPQHAFAERGVDAHPMADGSLTFRVGKAAAGRLLDGQIHDAFPEVRHG